ncbi:hypothetical protein PRIC1_004371 [Phytophthora ramorum]
MLQQEALEAMSNKVAADYAKFKFDANSIKFLKGHRLPAEEKTSQLKLPMDGVTADKAKTDNDGWPPAISGQFGLESFMPALFSGSFYLSLSTETVRGWEGFVCFDATVRFLLGQEHRLEARHGQRKKRALGDDAFDWSGGKGELKEPSEQASDASEEQKECGSNQMLVMTHRPSHYASTLLRP